MPSFLSRILLALLFFISGSILPMGDFSLMQDLPAMYHNYSRLTTDEDAGVIDFIGDYLLGGREIFDHNKNDKTDSRNGGVNFQHQANPLPIIFVNAHESLTFVNELPKEQVLLDILSISPANQTDLFRPPIV